MPQSIINTGQSSLYGDITNQSNSKLDIAGKSSTSSSGYQHGGGGSNNTIYSHAGGGGTWTPDYTDETRAGEKPATYSYGDKVENTNSYVRERTLKPRDHFAQFKVLIWNTELGEPSKTDYTKAVMMRTNPMDIALAQGMPVENIRKVKLNTSDDYLYIVPWKPVIENRSDVPVAAHGTAQYPNMGATTISGNPLNMMVRNGPSDSINDFREVTFAGSSTKLYEGMRPDHPYQVTGLTGLEEFVIPKTKTINLSDWIQRKSPQYLDGSSFEQGDGAYPAVYTEPDNPFGDIAEKASPKQTFHPMHPFMRVYPQAAHSAIWTSYNRTKLPIADIEHRKAFRHLFITRPECYICCASGSGSKEGSRLSEQAEFDEEFHSSYMRYPHVSQMLSPVYVCKSPGPDEFANWNYLLTNRVQGLNVAAMNLGVRESVATAVRGNAVNPGTIITTNNGGTIDLQFRDTKYMDVYEMIRMWMWYIHKRTTGEFFPPFNGYKFQNSWNMATSGTGELNGYTCSHPYDRALEYCASLYDIVVDETGTNILYWCKYYGIYPVSLSNGMLSNDKNGPLINEATITTTFRYQYKLENVYRTLCEFNYNAGLTPELVRGSFDDVASFINKSCYFGAGGMFTGTPFIVSQQSLKRNPLNPEEHIIYTPRLCFHIPDGAPGVDFMNVGLMNNNGVRGPSTLQQVVSAAGVIARAAVKTLTGF